MPVSAEQMQQVVDNIGGAHVLILGDIMLDEYLFGTVNRISPEAPVPVVEIDSDNILLGGAANVAANINSLGDKPILVGVVGEDDAAGKLRVLLDDNNIPSEYLLVDNTRRTTIKTRIIAHNQQTVRADREDRHELSDELQGQIMERLESLKGTVRALIISDYGKGVITLKLLQSVIRWCRDNDVFIAVDPKETHFHHYKHVSVITPNHHEAGFAFGRRINNEADLLAVGNGLLEKLDARSILITRGPDGMSLFQREGEPTHIPTFARQVYDVTGAGDTVIATFVSAITAGADLVQAAVMANAGAGITVGKIGTATVTTDELRRELDHNLRNGRLQATRPATQRATPGAPERS